MADPTPEELSATAQAAQDAALALDALQQNANGASQSLQGLNIASFAAQDVFKSFNSVIASYGMSLNTVGALTEQQTAQMSLLASGVIGARKAFDGLAGIDTGSMRTFKDQFAELAETVSNSPFLDATGKAAQLIGTLTKMGAPAADVKKAAEGGTKAIVAYGASFFESADNALRLQNAIIQLGGKTGQLGNIYVKAGQDLSNINSIMSQHNVMIAETVKATGLNEKQVESYYAALGTVPGAFEKNIKGIAGADSGINMLTATIKLATGDGRKYEEVIGDLHTAFKEYGMVGQDAMQFTQRFSDVSNKFNIELDDVKTHLLGASSAFKNFSDAGAAAGRMSESLAGIMNDYVGSLKLTGMTGQHAMEVVKGMTDSIAGMSVAQKAFLSAQTGGQGGLMGAFQIEKMLKDGKGDEVFEKVRQTMQKQFGKIATLDEAASSPAAASQLQKQMLLLQKGPLGGMVKTDQDAYRLLDTMRAKQDGRQPADQGAKGLAEQTVQQAIHRGTTIQEKSFTQLSAINANIAAIRRSADIPNLNTVQKSGTIGVGRKDFLGEDSIAQAEMRTSMRTQMRNSAAKGGSASNKYAIQMGSDQIPVLDKSGAAAASAVNELNDWFKKIPASMQAPLDTLKQAVLSGDQAAVTSQLEAMDNDIKEKRSSAAKMTKEEKTKALASAQREEEYVKGMKQWYSQYGSGASTDMSPSTAVGAAPKMLPQAKAARGGGTASGSSLPTPEVYVTEDGATGRIKVQVNVKVLEDGGQGKSITPTY